MCSFYTKIVALRQLKQETADCVAREAHCCAVAKEAVVNAAETVNVDDILQLAETKAA